MNCCCAFDLSDIVRLGTFDRSLAVCAVPFTEVLSDFSLQIYVVPVHISLDQVHNRSNVARQQWYVDILWHYRWHIHRLVLAQLLQTNHFSLRDNGRWNRDFCVLHVVGLDFRNDQFSCLVIPVRSRIRFFIHTHVRAGICSGSCSPTWFHLRSVSIRFNYT